MLSIEQIYVWGFLALSGAIGLARWPHRRRSTGLICGFIALLLSIALGWQVTIVSSSWFALGQRLDFLIGELQNHRSLLYMLLLGVVQTLNILTDFLAVTAYEAFPGLSINLGVCLIFLALYLAFKTTILLLGWLMYRLNSGLVLIYNRLNGREHRSRKVDTKSPSSVYSVKFLYTITTSLLVVLTPLLAALPYITAMHPALNFHFNTLFWPGVWIMLMELHQWLHSGKRPYSRDSRPQIAGRGSTDKQSWLARLQHHIYKSIGDEPR